MKIYCTYSQELHRFLNEVVKLVLDKYGSQLNINTLEEIELVNKRKYNYITDGKAYIGRISKERTGGGLNKGAISSAPLFNPLSVFPN